MTEQRQERAAVGDIGAWPRQGSLADPDRCACGKPLHPGRDCAPPADQVRSRR